MGLRIAKMSGAGNDFVVVGPDRRAGLEGDGAWIRRVCRRGLSLGADGVVFVGVEPDGRVRVEFRNPDGSAAFCGNGSRCAARFAAVRGLANSPMRLVTAAGDVSAHVEGERVRLGVPPPRLVERVRLPLDDTYVEGWWIDAGTPHFVVPVDSLDGTRLRSWGPRLRRHARFGDGGVNVDLMRVTARDEVRIRTWERGVEAETLACGSGAVAAALASRLSGGADRVTVVPWSGVALQVALSGAAERPSAAELTGDARFVVEGELHDEATNGFPA